MRAYKFRISPNKQQSKALEEMLFACFKLYNTAVEHRREAYRIAKKSVSLYDQINQLPEIKEGFPEFYNVHSQVLQNVLQRVDLAFKGFFRRVKISKDKCGFPRYKSLDRYDSFCFIQSGFKITGKHVCLSKIGNVKIKLHRSVPDGSKIKTCTVKREGKIWFVVFACEIQNSIPEKKTVTNAIGIDLGLTDFVVLSNGEAISNPKYLKKSEEKLKEVQSKYSKGKSKKCKRQLTNLHYKIANQRKDFQHKLSRKLVNSFDLIAYEDLKVKQMIEDNKYNLQKHIHDASWGQFISMLKYKAEDAGTYIIAVNPKGTTQKCSCCGAIVAKTISERSHKCLTCGFESTRDHNAALNIKKSGIDLVDNSVCTNFVHPFLFTEANVL